MIFITGMHHSGTSILAETVKRLGFDFGKPLDRHNENESLKVIDDLLIGDWMNPSPPSQQIVDGCIDMAQEPLWAVEAYKNPRMMMNAPFWHELTRHDGEPTLWIRISRDRDDVATSMMRDTDRPQDRLFWLELQDLYEASWQAFVRRDAPYVHEVDYRTMCENPDRTVLRLADALECIEYAGIDDWRGEPDMLKVTAVRRWARETYKFKTYGAA